MALIDNLISYWKLDESSGNAADSVGSNTLTNNNTVSYVSGLINNGADLGSTNTNKSLKNSTNFGIAGAGDLSIQFWLKMNTEISTGEQILFAFRTTLTADRYIQLAYQYNFGSRRLSMNSANVFGTYFTSLGTASYHHFVITRSSTTVKVYLDNTERISHTQGSASASGNYLSFGYDGGSTGYTSGTYDELAIWNRAITTSEISELYNGGLGFQHPFVVNTYVPVTSWIM